MFNWNNYSAVQRNDQFQSTIIEYDNEVDKGSINVGKQRYEKMMAGMYLGELVRYILLDLCRKGIVFTKDALPILERPSKWQILLFYKF